MSFMQLAGSIAFITSVIGLLPQLVKTVQSRSTHDISMLMLINYLVCSIAWIIYGAYTDAGFVLYSNVLGSLSSVALIGLKWRYDRA